MARFIKAAEGYLLHRAGDASPIPEGAEVVEFDESTNPELLASLCGQLGYVWQDHSIVGGQILRAGQPVAISPPRARSDVEELSQAVVALALLSLEEFNAVRQWVTGFKAAVAAAASLADLKTRVGSLPNTPDRTRRQLLDAVRAKLADVEA